MSPTSEPSPSGDPTARERIVEAADELFAEVGFDAASTRHIAELAAVQKGLLHYHFRTKQLLFDAVLDRYYDQLSAALVGCLEGAGSPRERFRTVLDTYVDFLAAHRGFSRVVQREVASGRHIERITAHMVPLLRSALAVIHGRYATTREGALSAQQLLVSFYGMVVTHFSYAPVLEGITGDDPTGPAGLALRKQHLHRMLDLVLDALETTAPHRPQ